MMGTMTATKITDRYGEEHELPGPPYMTIASIRKANEGAGQYFFSPSTMRFFRSRVAPGVIAGRVFITSEQFDESSPRLYTVRLLDDAGHVADVSEFQQFRTLDAARRFARKLTDS